MLHGLRDTCQKGNMFQKTCKTLGYMNNIVCKITPGGSKAICIPWPILLNGLYNEFVVNHYEQGFGGLLTANGQVITLF